MILNQLCFYIALVNKSLDFTIVRIVDNYAHICIMKTRLNITVEQHLLKKVKVYALNQQVSLSSLIEGFFEKVVNTNAKRKSLLE